MNPEMLTQKAIDRDKSYFLMKGALMHKPSLKSTSFYRLKLWVLEYELTIDY